MKHSCPNARVPQPEQKAGVWNLLMVRLLQCAFASFVHAGNLRVTTAVQQESRDSTRTA
jgi:hypothetical protein